MHAWSCSIVYWSFAQQWFIEVITSLECSQRSFYDIRKSLVNISIYSIRAVLAFLFYVYIYTYICICMCMRVGMSLPWCTGGGERTTCRIQFSSSSLWVLGIELKLLGLTSSTLLASPKQRNRKGLSSSLLLWCSLWLWCQRSNKSCKCFPSQLHFQFSETFLNIGKLLGSWWQILTFHLKIGT